MYSQKNTIWPILCISKYSYTSSIGKRATLNPSDFFCRPYLFTYFFMILPGYMLAVFLTLSLFFLFISLSIPLVVFTHELGHAIPALIFRKGEVTVIIGSPQDWVHQYRFRLKRLKFEISRNPLDWYYGMCKSNSPTYDSWSFFIIVFSGPILSLLLALFFAYITFVTDLHGILKIFGISSFITSVAYFFWSLWPKQFIFSVTDNLYHYNDGQQILTVLQYKVMPRKLSQALALYSEGKYQDSAELIESLDSYWFYKSARYRYGICSQMMIGNFEKATDYHKRLTTTITLAVHDLSNWALLLPKQDNFEQAEEKYKESLAMNPNK